MAKNDYRRALILLRSNEMGLQGHVRLECRTTMGSMQFNVSGLGTDCAPLQAAMAAKTAAGWKITHIGTLGQNGRGQAGLNWTFDPRSIEGIPLEKYEAFLILKTFDGSCKTALTGYVNGARQIDWERAEAAACESYSQIPAPAQEPLAAEEPVARNDEPVALQEEHAVPGEELAVAEKTDVLDEPSEEPAAPQVPMHESLLDIPATGEEAREVFWPENIAPLREYFANKPAADSPEISGYTFVETGADGCKVGVCETDGRIGSVAYAIPGEFSEIPPAGLEGYLWRDGYWVVQADAESGEYI